MLGRLYEGQDCSAARALEIVGERWSLLILRDALFKRITRFSDFQRSLGLAPNILARRLDRLVEAGIMEFRPSRSDSEHQVYVLTAKGMDFKAAVVALTVWGDKWLSPGPAVFEHVDCGGPVEQLFHCTVCGVFPKVTAVQARSRTPKGPRKSRATTKRNS
jgi:DNA-binding HxlR family transcriptional regulator